MEESYLSRKIPILDYVREILIFAQLHKHTQLTSEHYRFKLHRSTYTQIFSTVNTMSTIDPPAVESTDVELSLSGDHVYRRLAIHMLPADFQLQGGSVPQTIGLFKGQLYMRCL